MNQHPRPTEWRGPDKPNRPGVHVVAYVVIGGVVVSVAVLWLTVGRAVVRTVAG